MTLFFICCSVFYSLCTCSIWGLINLTVKEINMTSCTIKTFESELVRNWIDRMGKTQDEYVARRMYESFLLQSNGCSGLKTVAEAATMKWWHEPGVGEDANHLSLSSRQLCVNDIVVGGWIHNDFYRLAVHLEPMTANRVQAGGELVVALFGQALVRIKTSSTGKSELMTVEGFYELLKKDEDLSAIIATIVHDASREMCRLMTGEEDPKGQEGGPAYQFADWLLGSRGRGKAV